MFAVVVIAITALNVRTVLSSDRSYDMNTSTIEAISGEDDPIDGGEIGDVEITCSKGGGSGKCYAKRTEVKRQWLLSLFLSMDRGDFRLL